MTTAPGPPVRQRSGGRSEQVRLAVGRAVLDLLAEGAIGFTTVEVAERARVSRRTLYRWWPQHEDLLAEALSQHTHSVEVPDTGSWSEDLRLFAHRIALFAATPVDLSLSRLMATGLHPGFSTAVIAHFEGAMAGWRAMLARAVERGDARDTHAATTVVNTLVSPLFLAPLSTGRAAEPEAVDRIVDLVLAATSR